MAKKASLLTKFRPARPHTNRKGGYNGGEHLVVCDRSGQVYDSSNTRKEWTGLIVGRDQWEPRNAQEFRRGIREDIAVPQARPRSALESDLPITLDDVTVVSGSVVGGVYTSDALDETRPFVFWFVDLGSVLELVDATLSGVSLSGFLPSVIRQGVFLQRSDDNITYTNIEPNVGNFDGGLTGSATNYVVPINNSARFLRLAMIGGKGMGYTGALTQTGLTVARNV